MEKYWKKLTITNLDKNKATKVDGTDFWFKYNFGNILEIWNKKKRARLIRGLYRHRRHVICLPDKSGRKNDVSDLAPYPGCWTTLLIFRRIPASGDAILCTPRRIYDSLGWRNVQWTAGSRDFKWTTFATPFSVAHKKFPLAEKNVCPCLS